MKTKTYLFLIFCVTLFSLGFFVFLLLNINPFNADILTISTFYVSLFIFIVGFFTLIGFYIRLKIFNNEIFYANFQPSFRQSVLIGLIIVGLIALKSLNVLTWWDGIMYSLAILLIELYFQNKNYHKT